MKFNNLKRGVIFILRDRVCVLTDVNKHKEVATCTGLDVFTNDTVIEKLTPKSFMSWPSLEVTWLKYAGDAEDGVAILLDGDGNSRTATYGEWEIEPNAIVGVLKATQYGTDDVLGEGVAHPDVIAAL